jgi:hypothetical protein
MTPLTCPLRCFYECEENVHQVSRARQAVRLVPLPREYVV